MKRIILYICIVLFCISGYAQQHNSDLDTISRLDQQMQIIDQAVKTLQKLNVSGYIQTQYQYAEADADGFSVKVGNPVNPVEREKLDNFSRFGIRRGRIKFTYEEGIVQGVFQPDITEKGIKFLDAFIAVKDPWLGTNELKTGVFAIPFGHEVGYASSLRESPERARIIQSLFPDVRDVGAMFTLQPPKTSKLNILKLEAGLFAGNGIRPQISSRMDFAGRLSVTQRIDNHAQFALGISAYVGGVQKSDAQIYVMKDKQFVVENNTPGNFGRYTKRHYFGVDAQLSIVTGAGLTRVKGEYIVGEHPGNASAAFDFKLTAIPTGPVYMRKIAGGYVMLSQDLNAIPLTFVGKYDWYNPNVKVSGNDIGVPESRTGPGDITRSTIGLGLLRHFTPVLKLTVYYDIVKNEQTVNLKDTKDGQGDISKYGYEGQRKENVFTFRLQYKF
ncbi:MAG: hypothetical protein LBE79_00910 [Tannerella sp.]|nr:hypothetical protein [Tannerella sp.]